MDLYNTSHFAMSTDFDNHKRHFSHCVIKSLCELVGTQYGDQNLPSREYKNCVWNNLIPQHNSVRHFFFFLNLS